MDESFQDRTFVFVVGPQARGPAAESLQRAGFNAVHLRDPAKLHHLLDQYPLAAVVFDVDTPQVEAASFLRAIRRRRRHVPVVALGDFSRPERLREVLQLNVGHVLCEPVDDRDLVSEVAKTVGYLHERARREQLLEEERTLAELLRLALQASTVDEFLHAVLDVLLDTVTWLELHPRGAIFLTRHDPAGRPYLRLAVQRELSAPLLESCARVPFGRCLCGRAAAQREIQFAACVDERHELGFPGMDPHGHYNVPLLDGDRVLGVMVLYLAHGHRAREGEQAFLRRVSDTVSLGLARRFQSAALDSARQSVQAAKEQLQSVSLALGAVLFRTRVLPDGGSRCILPAASREACFASLAAALEEGGLDGLLALVHEPDREAMARVLERQRQDPAQPVAVDVRLELGARGPRWFHYVARAAGGDSGEVSWDSLLLDVHERKALEQQLLQAQKLEAVGQLAAGIAHEINTPVQFVSDNTHFLEESFAELLRLIAAYRRLREAAEQGSIPEELLRELRACEQETDLEFLGEEIPEALRQSLDGLSKISRIVAAMKAFSHVGAAEKEPVDINRLLTDTVTISRNEWKYVARVELDLEEGLPSVPGHVNELGQVFLNLIVNAAHAIAGIGSSGGRQGKGRILVSTYRKGTEVHVRIADDGPGVPAEIRDRIFDPFFTTKEVGKGTGQGLSIAHGIVVDQHGGTLRLEDSPAEGASFVVALPLAA